MLHLSRHFLVSNLYNTMSHEPYKNNYTYTKSTSHPPSTHFTRYQIIKSRFSLTIGLFNVLSGSIDIDRRYKAFLLAVFLTVSVEMAIIKYLLFKKIFYAKGRIYRKRAKNSPVSYCYHDTDRYMSCDFSFSGYLSSDET